MTGSVHDQPDYERVYDDDAMVEVRRGDLQALLDLATGSLDFGSGFWDNEQVEIARGIADVLDIDPLLVTPVNFLWQYGCLPRGEHQWSRLSDFWLCDVCGLCSRNDVPPSVSDRPSWQE